MRLQVRSLLLFPALLALGFCFLLAGARRLGGMPMPVWLALWVGLGNLILFLALRCPHCRRRTVLRPGGWSSPFVGRHCPHCKQEC